MQKNFALTTICLYTTYIVYLFSNQSFFFEIIIYITYFYTGIVIFRFKKYFFDNKLVLLSMLGTFVLQILATQFAGAFFNTVPLSLFTWVKIVALSFIVIIASEIFKLCAKLFFGKR